MLVAKKGKGSSRVKKKHANPRNKRHVLVCVVVNGDEFPFDFLIDQLPLKCNLTQGKKDAEKTLYWRGAKLPYGLCGGMPIEG